tara:strand:- start:2053 stop:2421 length:369 start_codon:yes stop_codon:yes gene_type:complete
MVRHNVLRFVFLLSVFCCLGLLQEASAQKTPKPATSAIVRGQVIDQESIPIPGTAIIVDGSTTGTANDFNGFFELDLSQFTEKKVTLVLQFVGTEKKKFEIKMKDLPKSYGQITLSRAVLEE